MTFSIIICAHNPNVHIFKRLLNAVVQFDVSAIQHEVIVIDNNSSPALKQEDFIKDFLGQKKNASLFTELTPGLTQARIAGIQLAKYDWIIFFDDDNEPARDYLQITSDAITANPQTGVWGPGEIDVEYTGHVEKWLHTKKELFQELNIKETLSLRENSWQACYPFGTGMIIKKALAVKYATRVAGGRYTLSDRKGKSLASGGDVQLVLTVIESGFAAGTIAGLRLNHLIHDDKATLSYLKKQQYGTASAYVKAYNQVFKDKKIPVLMVTNYSIFLKIYSLFRIHRPNLNKRDFKLLMAATLGGMNAFIVASEKPKPLLLKWYEKMIHV